MAKNGVGDAEPVEVEPTAPPVTISAKGGKEAAAIGVEITDPYGNYSLSEYIERFGEAIVLEYFQVSRVIAIQRTIRAALKKNGVDAAIKAGLAKCESLDPIRRANAKTSRKTRAEVEASFIAQGLDVAEAAIKAIIDALFVK